MPLWTCEQCGAQFPENAEPPPACLFWSISSGFLYCGMVPRGFKAANELVTDTRALPKIQEPCLRLADAHGAVSAGANIPNPRRANGRL